MANQVELDIRLKKVNKVYKENEIVSGVVFIQSRGEFKHDGIMLSMEGTVNLQLSAKNTGLFEGFYNSVKPIQLVSCSLEVTKAGKLPGGKVEIPFEIPLKPRGSKALYETYHGVFVTIQYLLKCEMKRSLLAKDISKATEFIVEYSEEDGAKATERLVPFEISPDTLKNVKDKAKIPNFKISGHLDSTICCLTKAFTGELRVEYCSAPIKSLELQLIRVEMCGCAEGYAKDATEIQNIQIGEGDVTHGLPIPIYMVFPRLFTCPSLSTSNFRIDFEVNVVAVFQDDHLVSENFPIELTRY